MGSPLFKNSKCPNRYKFEAQSWLPSPENYPIKIAGSLRVLKQPDILKDQTMDENFKYFYLTSIGWIHTISVYSFQPIILNHEKNVYFRPLSYPLRSLSSYELNNPGRCRVIGMSKAKKKN